MFRITDSGTVDVGEIFHVPDDYREIENECGQRLTHGWWWWVVDRHDSFAPISYPVGPFDTNREAADDYFAAGAWCPVDC